MAKPKPYRVRQLEGALSAALGRLSHEADELTMCRTGTDAEIFDFHSGVVARLRAAYERGMVALVGPAGRKLARPPL